MKKLALVLVFSLVAGAAFAQGWNSNNIGVYLDPMAESACGFGTGSIPCYVIGTGLQTPTVGGFEMKLVVDGPAFGPLNPAFPVDAVNFGTRESEWIVGYGSPAPTSNAAVVFMTFDLFVTADTAPTSLFISPIYFASLPGSCAYLDGADYNIILPLYNSTGDPITGANVPVMTMNDPNCVVPSEDASWGDVKSLFR